MTHEFCTSRCFILCSTAYERLAIILPQSQVLNEVRDDMTAVKYFGKGYEVIRRLRTTVDEPFDQLRAVTSGGSLDLIHQIVS